MAESNDPLQRIEAYVVALRGRGLVLSSSDIALLDAWLRAGVPPGVLLEGIDSAFAANRTPPASVLACLHHIRRSISGWSSAFDHGQVRSVEVVPSDASMEEVNEEEPPEVSVPLWLASQAEATRVAPLARAFRALHSEVVALLAEEGTLGARTLAVLDEALVDSLLEDGDAALLGENAVQRLQAGPAFRVLKELAAEAGESDWSALPPSWRR